MARQIFIGLLAEGPTDHRFLQSIIARTFNSLKFECAKDIDIGEITILTKEKGQSFVDSVLHASTTGLTNFGMTILCIQADADSKTLESTYKNKIQKAVAALDKETEEQYCKTLVAIVPIQETEAWMLGDIKLLKEEIGTNKTAKELGLPKQPENVASPKEVIEAAIKIARKGKTRRRRHQLTIAELYLPIGQSINLKKLAKLHSYQDFQKNVRNAFKQLNLLH